ncbi:SPOR domain-containing protein [Pseudodonghicola sp. IC7]|uniref:SPOR domain-containing protein n=2 Tax=Pseudodonghicola flavimaris TaxID=3050036 RepID=A0ABT7F0F0_9RHOB|nr:SPOR domain-containing protein [Pseudodonghicola flavimaris]MDK3018060.1 SPOR domain-containing protein [Pseudodonghicola flavimaris]
MLLAACEDGVQMPGFMKSSAKSETGAPAQSSRTKLVARDVEAPEVFQVTETGLWDGRPSLGGVWVAHPDVVDPERVIIRNTENGKFVIGALFRRERAIPGPRIQASSDAAEALGMLAGAPVELNVTALRRETLDPPPEETTVAEAPEAVEETALAPVAGAAAAIDAPPPAAQAEPAAKPAATPPAKASSLRKPYVQIGIFSVKANAERTATQMRGAGMIPTVLEQELNGKQFWRVVVGPARTKSELNALLKQVKETGFSDAYAVSN